MQRNSSGSDVQAKPRSIPSIRKDRSRVHYKRFHNIYIYITEKCQLRCGHCYMGDRLERSLNMKLSQAKKVLNYCRRLGGEYVTFLGGEPTLHPQLPSMVDYARDLGYQQVMLNSNGLLSKRIYEIAPNKLHYVSISLDGATAATHEAVRGKKTFKKTIDCIKAAVSGGYSVRIICTISKVNIHEASELLNLADVLGVNMVNFHVFSEEGNGKANTDWSLAPHQWMEFYEGLEVIKGKYRTSIWYPPTYASPVKLERFVREGYQGCVGCSLDRLSIFPDGRCYVCSVLFDHPVHFGVLGEAGLELNKGENEFDLFSAAHFRSEEPWLSGCPAERFLERQGKPKTPEDLISICRLWKSQA